MIREISDKLRFSKINPHIFGKEVLDIGATEGNLHQLLVNANPSIKFYTLDISSPADFIMDLNSPKKLKNKFDTIIAGEILEHLDNPTNFLGFCHDHLKDNGRLILTTPNAIGLQYIRNPSWCVERGNFHSHICAFTLPMLNILFQKSKLTVVHTELINAFWTNRNPLQLIPIIFQRLKTDILIIGSKESHL